MCRVKDRQEIWVSPSKNHGSRRKSFCIPDFECGEKTNESDLKSVLAVDPSSSSAELFKSLKRTFSPGLTLQKTFAFCYFFPFGFFSSSFPIFLSLTYRIQNRFQHTVYVSHNMMFPTKGREHLKLLKSHPREWTSYWAGLCFLVDQFMHLKTFFHRFYSWLVRFLRNSEIL